MLNDIVVSSSMSLNISILKAELYVNHLIKCRAFVLKYVPENSVGAELGVFTGLFSSILARSKRISTITFVDPWWEAYGDTYPDWGPYTDYGRLTTRGAFHIASKRISQSELPNRTVKVWSSLDLLESISDKSLD
jgi:hypothetical protein